MDISRITLLRGKRWPATLGILLLALCAAGIAAPTPPPSPSSRKPPVLFPEDAWLNRTVTVRKPRVYLGELVSELSAVGCIPLAVSATRGPVDGIQLTALIKDRPLREVMTALQTLFTNRYDQWEWRKPTSDQAEQKAWGGYILVHKRTPSEASAAAREAILARWVADVKAFREVARLPEPQRTEAARRQPRTFPGGIVMPQAGLFSKLSESEFNALLRGAEAGLNPRQLDDADRDALELGITTSEPRNPVPGSTPGFYTAWDGDAVGPVIWLRNEHHEAVNVVGGPGWEVGWLLSEGDGWRYLDQEVYNYVLQSASDNPTAGKRLPGGSLADWLLRLHDRQRMNVLLDYAHPGPRGSLGGAWLGSTLEQSAMALIARGGLTERKSGEIYLFRDKTALIHPRAHLLPWAILRDMRRAAERGQGYLGFPELRRLTEMTQEQREGLSEEFPDAGSSMAPDWRPVSRFLQKLEPSAQRRLTGPDGLKLRDSGLVARAALGAESDAGGIRNLELLRREFDRATVALRFEPYERRTKNGMVTARRLVWEVRVPDSLPHVRTYPLDPRKPLQPE